MVDLILKSDLEAFEARILSKIADIFSNTESQVQNTTKWISVEEAARMLQVEKSTLYNWKASGELTYSKFGGKLYFDREDIERKFKENMVIRIG